LPGTTGTTPNPLGGAIPTTGTLSAGADAIAAANMPSTGGQIVYFRVE
jgi:hypothetical protein